MSLNPSAYTDDRRITRFRVAYALGLLRALNQSLDTHYTLSVRL
jgi:hypothetical protein